MADCYDVAYRVDGVDQWKHGVYCETLDESFLAARQLLVAGPAVAVRIAEAFTGETVHEFNSRGDVNEPRG